MSGMKRSALVAIALLAGACAAPSAGITPGRYEVFGVGEGDMLKLRAGPGTGFTEILGLPNGTEVQVRDCVSTGATRWCNVALSSTVGVEGFASYAYLRPKS